MKKLVLILTLLTMSLSTIAADLVIDSKTQTYSEHDNKIKFEGNVNVQIDDVKVVGEQADVTVSPNMKPDIVTFYDKPYAYEVKDNKKREVKANILKLSLLNKTIKSSPRITVGSGASRSITGLVYVFISSVPLTPEQATPPASVENREIAISKRFIIL